MAVKVRCERIVPIRGAVDMFKKSSVIVTRLIEIDLQVRGYLLFPVRFSLPRLESYIGLARMC